MNGELRSLLKKELRAIAGTYVAVGVLLVCAMWAVLVLIHTHGNTNVPSIVGVVVSVLSAFLGAVTFAGEKQSGTIDFLTNLPVSRREIFKSKLAVTAPVAVILALVLTILSALEAFPPPGHRVLTENYLYIFVSIVLPMVVPAVLYAFGVLFSLIVDTVVIATLGAIALFTIVSALLTLPYTAITRAFPNLSDLATGILVAAFAAVGVILALAALLLARRLFCGRAQE